MYINPLPPKTNNEIIVESSLDCGILNLIYCCCNSIGNCCSELYTCMRSCVINHSTCCHSNVNSNHSQNNTNELIPLSQPTQSQGFRPRLASISVISIYINESPVKDIIKKIKSTNEVGISINSVIRILSGAIVNRSANTESPETRKEKINNFFTEVLLDENFLFSELFMKMFERYEDGNHEKQSQITRNMQGGYYTLLEQGYQDELSTFLTKLHKKIFNSFKDAKLTKDIPIEIINMIIDSTYGTNVKSIKGSKTN